MLVWFHSDAQTGGTGFLMDWFSTEGSGIGPNPTNVPTIPPGYFPLSLLSPWDFYVTIDKPLHVVLGTCGSNHLVAPLAPVPLYSPGWPDNYPNNQDCQWLIESAQGYRSVVNV